jgi:hypothetical protein
MSRLTVILTVQRNTRDRSLITSHYHRNKSNDNISILQWVTFNSSPLPISTTTSKTSSQPKAQEQIYPSKHFMIHVRKKQKESCKTHQRLCTSRPRRSQSLDMCRDPHQQPRSTTHDSDDKTRHEGKGHPLHCKLAEAISNHS